MQQRTHTVWQNSTGNPKLFTTAVGRNGKEGGVVIQSEKTGKSWSHAPLVMNTKPTNTATFQFPLILSTHSLGHGSVCLCF